MARTDIAEEQPLETAKDIDTTGRWIRRVSLAILGVAVLSIASTLSSVALTDTSVRNPAHVTVRRLRSPQDEEPKLSEECKKTDATNGREILLSLGVIDTGLQAFEACVNVENTTQEPCYSELIEGFSKIQNITKRFAEDGPDTCQHSPTECQAKMRAKTRDGTPLSATFPICIPKACRYELPALKAEACKGHVTCSIDLTCDSV